MRNGARAAQPCSALVDLRCGPQTTRRMFPTLRLRPDDLPRVLLDQVGFASHQVLFAGDADRCDGPASDPADGGTPDTAPAGMASKRRQPGSGFQRPIWLFLKGDAAASLATAAALVNDDGAHSCT